MKLISIFLFIIPFTTSPQELTREQKKKSGILTKYVWQSADSTKSDHNSNRMWFLDKKDYSGNWYQGYYHFDWVHYIIDWKWVDPKATQILIILLSDTLTLTNIKLTDKIFTADVKIVHWGKPRFEKLRRFPVMTMEEWDNQPMEVEEPKLIQ